MDINKEIIENFEREITRILHSGESGIKLAALGTELCHTTMLQLKKAIKENHFKSILKEVQFYKRTVPSVMSYLIFFSEMRTCLIIKPKSGKEFLMRFFKKRIKKINKFFYRNTDFCQYMELGHTYFDVELFSQVKERDFAMTPFAIYYQFSEILTYHSMLWSKIMAMHRLLEFIRQEMKLVKLSGNFPVGPSQHRRRLQWTYSKTALIELIYALYSDGALNHGRANLNAITSSFEDFFNVRLDNFSKTYTEIKGRKGSKTKFLEELMFSLEYKINKEDSI